MPRSTYALAVDPTTQQSIGVFWTSKVCDSITMSFGARAYTAGERFLVFDALNPIAAQAAGAVTEVCRDITRVSNCQIKEYDAFTMRPDRAIVIGPGGEQGFVRGMFEFFQDDSDCPTSQEAISCHVKSNWTCCSQTGLTQPFSILALLCCGDGEGAIKPVVVSNDVNITVFLEFCSAFTLQAAVEVEFVMEGDEWSINPTNSNCQYLQLQHFLAPELPVMDCMPVQQTACIPVGAPNLPVAGPGGPYSPISGGIPQSIRGEVFGAGPFGGRNQ